MSFWDEHPEYVAGLIIIGILAFAFFIVWRINNSPCEQLSHFPVKDLPARCIGYYGGTP